MNEELRDRIFAKLEVLETDKRSYLLDLQTKIRRDDAHGAIDCLMDMRDIEAEKKALQEVLELLGDTPKIRG